MISNNRLCKSYKKKLSKQKERKEQRVNMENDPSRDYPARARPNWPKKVIPWWIPSCPKEKPPYSYATLIAQAILCSKEGRLTLNEIYIWISNHYQAYPLSARGWKNSIRHNLSLNKKWFQKLDRRPTQRNPGKGSYWTLFPGAEQVFMDSLTQEGSYKRIENNKTLDDKDATKLLPLYASFRITNKTKQENLTTPDKVTPSLFSKTEPWLLSEENIWEPFLSQFSNDSSLVETELSWDPLFMEAAFPFTQNEPSSSSLYPFVSMQQVLYS